METSRRKRSGFLSWHRLSAIAIAAVAVLVGSPPGYAAPVRVTVSGSVHTVNDPDGHLSAFGLNVRQGGAYEASYTLDPESEPIDNFDFFFIESGALDIAFDGGTAFRGEAPSRVFIDDDRPATTFPNLGTFDFTAGDRWTVERDLLVEGLGQLFVYIGFVDDSDRFSGEEYFPNLTVDDWQASFFFIGYLPPDGFRFEGLAFGASVEPVPLPVPVWPMAVSLLMLGTLRRRSP